LYVADPDMVQDLWVKKNSIFDKTGNFVGIFSKLFGNSFLFSKADEIWKAKRKACSHAFYKERLVHMLEVLKDKI
jgi:cytochrome P450